MIWVLVILLTITLSVFRYRSRQKKIDAAIRDQGTILMRLLLNNNNNLNP